MSRIVVVDSMNMDLVINILNIPGPGEMILGERFLTFPGGKGANQAVAAARFANAAGALAATKQGAQPSLPLRSEVVRFLEKAEAV